MKHLICTDIQPWKDQVFKRDLYEADEIPNDIKITQVQAVVFTDLDHLVFYKHIDGYLGLPGGTPEEDESFEETLKRELEEEIGGRLIVCGLFGYVIVTRQDVSEEPYVQLRYWAQVELLDADISDPAQKSLGRVVVPREKAVDVLNWGEWGKVQIECAEKYFLKHLNKD